MKLSYKPIPRDKHFSKCQIPNCKLPTVSCTSIMPDQRQCNCMGHPEYYKSGEDKIVLVVKHAHFLPLEIRDKGRNDFHKIKVIIAPEEIKQQTWRVKNDGARWARLPPEVRYNLGWDELD